MDSKPKIFEKIENRGVVVLLDALGSKARWKGMVDTYEQLQWFNQWNELIKITEIVTKEEFGNFKVKIKSFSDTLLLTFSHINNDLDLGKSELDVNRSLVRIASSYVGFFSSCALNMRIPFRGGISFGNFLEDDNSIMGDALIDVAEYYELPHWIGISLTPSAYKIIYPNKLTGNRITGNLINYDIPLKIGLEKDGIALNMFADYSRTKKTLSDPDSPYKKYKVIEKMDFSNTISTIFENIMSKTSNIEHTVKIRNTLAYLKYIESLPP